VIVGFVAVVPALEIVTPEPCTIETVPVAPVLRMLMTAPVVNATLDEFGMVIVVVLVFEYVTILFEESANWSVSEVPVTARKVRRQRSLISVEISFI
jgi:hypothetical protein